MDKKIKAIEHNIEFYSTLSKTEKLRLIDQIKWYINVDKYESDLMEKRIPPIEELSSIEPYLTDPRSLVAQETIRDYIFEKINFKIALQMLFFLVFPTISFLYLSIRSIQILLIDKWTYVLVEGFLVMLIPIVVLSLSLEGYYVYRVFSLDFFIKKLGEDFGKQAFYALRTDKTDPEYKELIRTGFPKKKKLEKYTIIILFIAVVSSLIFISLCVTHYTAVDEKGIYQNHWFSLEEKFYNWDEVDNIYYEYGRILRDNNRYHPYDKPLYVFYMNDNTRIETQDAMEIHGQKDEMYNFIIEKSGLTVEEIIWNVSNDEYIPYSLEVIQNYEMDYG